MPNETIGEWARTVAFQKPVKLGEVEAAILARPLPAAGAKASSGKRSAQIVFGFVFLAVVVALPFLAFIPLNAAQNANNAHDAGTLVDIAGSMTLVGAAIPLVPLLMWGALYDRHRVGPITAAATVFPITAIVAAVLLWGASWSFTPFIAGANIAGVVISIVLCLLVFLASKPGPMPPSGFDRVGVQTEEDAARLKERTIALHVLRTRGLVDDATYRRALDLPLGSWSELDR